MMTETGEATKKVKHKKKKQEKEIEKTKLEDLPYDEHLKGLQELKELAQNDLFSGSKLSYKNKKAELKLDVEPVISITDDDLLKNIEINKDPTEIIRIDFNGHKDNKENIKTDIADDVMSSVFHEFENDLYSATEPNINIVIKEELENFKEIVSVGIVSPTAPELDDADELGFDVGCLYPKLSHVENESEQLEPFTEEQLRTLYCNEWLQLADGFIEKFYNDSTDDSKHEFFHLVNDYKMARHKYLMLKQDINALKKEVQRLKSLVWQVNSTTTSLKGRCKDDWVVTGDVTYETISLNEGMALEHKTALDHLKEATHHMALTAFRVHLYRMRIEDYIRKFHDDHPGLLNVPRNLPVQFKSEVDVADDVNNDAVKLKELIGVLFAFERMSVRDEEFVRDIRTWLTNMVSCLLRHASLHDHMYLLLHVLHSPSGVNTWAVNFVQPNNLPDETPPNVRPANVVHDDNFHDSLLTVGPLSDEAAVWNDDHFNHNVARLALILKPMKYRSNMLRSEDEDESAMKLLSNGQPLDEHASTSTPAQPSNSNNEEWIVVDSDGEDVTSLTLKTSLHEKDMLALINQIPADVMLRNAFLVNNSFQYLSESSFLRLLALANRLIEIFGKAMRTFHQPHYRRISKKLGQLIKYTVQCVCDAWVAYKSGVSFTLQRTIMSRLQLQSDVLIMKAVQLILDAPTLGSWQFMTMFPFDTMTAGHIWSTLHFMHLACYQASSLNVQLSFAVHNCKLYLYDDATLPELADKLLLLSQTEATYLLSTLANIACMRGHRRSHEGLNFISNSAVDDDVDIIKFVVHEIFYISYVSQATRELYSKLGRDLLQSISMQHPAALSFIMQLTQKHMSDVGIVSHYLFKCLPLHTWQPLTSDISILRTWLVQTSVNSHAHLLARIIIDHFDWSCQFSSAQHDVQMTDHSVSVVHLKIAQIILEAYSKHVSLKNNSFRLTFENVLNAPLSMSTTVKAQKCTTSMSRSSSSYLPSDVATFVDWAWCVCMRLKLHKSSTLHQQLPLHSDPHSPHRNFQHAHMEERIQERNQPSMHLEYSDAQSQQQLPPLNIRNVAPPSEDNECVAYIRSKLKQDDQCFLSSYLALSLCSLGNNPSDFLCEGLMRLQGMVDNHLHIPALHLISNILPAFYDDRDLCNKLLLQPSFQKCFDGWLSFDQQPSSPDADNPGHTTTMVEQLLICSLRHLAYFDTKTRQFSNVIHLWVSSLTNVSRWFGNRNVLYILDNMIRAVFHHTRSLSGVDRYFDPFVKTPLDATLPTISMTTSTILSGISSFFFGPRSQTNFISDSPAANQFWWFRFAVMKSEARKFEEESGLEINKELMKNPSLDIQVVFQLACKKLGVLPSPLLHYHHLSIYRQAAFILDIPQHHFLFPLLWNDFLTSYMHRPPNKDGIGHRYFALPEDISLLKRLKKCSSDVQLNLSGKADEKPLLAMYRAITLWLDEPRLHDRSLSFSSLPSQYLPNVLNAIINKHSEAWIAFVDKAGMSDVISTQIKRWFLDSIEGKVSSNVKHLNNLRTSMAIKSSSERLNAHLLQNVSSKPQPAPLLLLTPHCHNFREQFLLDHQRLNIVIEADLKVANTLADSFVRRSSLNKHLNDEIVRLLRVLHLNVSTESVVTLRCKSYVSPLHRCKGPAVLTLRHQQKCVDEIVNRNLTEQENKLMRLTTESSTPPHQSVFLSFIRLENIIDALVKCQGLTSPEMRSKHEYAQVATFLFYKILSNMAENNNSCPITTESFSSYVDILGKAFIVNNPSQPSVLLLAIQHNPNFNSMLTPFFNPQSNLKDFVQLYAQVLQMLPSKASGASNGGDDDDDDSDEYVLLGNSVGNDSRIILSEDVVLCLLTKFDITSWLMHARTTYADHVELLNHITNALMITKHSTRMQVVFKQHLLVLCKHRPPGHLVFHLMDALLKGTESGRLNADVWEIMLNVIGCTWTNAFDDEQNFSFSFDENVINLFSEEEVLKIIQIMGCYFHGRLQHNSNNSNKRSSKWFNIRYRKYVKQFGKVLFCVSLLIIQHTYNSTMRSSSYDPITNITTSVDMLFDKIQYIYDPWISWKNNLKQCWLENCNLLTTNMHLVSTMMLSWVKSLEAVQTYFGGKIHQPCQLLNRLWHFYVVQSDVQAMPNFLSDVLHNHLYLLPWRFYLPTVSCLLWMVKATDYSKPCFEMVGHVFTSVDWLEAVDRLRRPNNYNERFSTGSDDRNIDEYENDCAVHRLIFALLVRLGAEETIIKNSQLSSLILSKNLFDWKQKVDSSTFQQAAQSYVDRCNYVNKIFSLDLTDCHTCVLSLLKEAACFNCREIAPTPEMLADEQYHLYPTLSSNRSKEEADVNDKRVSYVRFVVQLIIKSSDASNLEHNGIILNNLLSEVEFVVKKCSVSAAPMCLECWSLLNSCNSIAAGHFLTVFKHWIESSVLSPILESLIRTSCRCLASLNHLVQILEAYMEAHFNLDVSETDGHGWTRILSVMNLPELDHREFVHESLVNGCYFTLHALALIKLSQCQSTADEVHILMSLNDWNTSANPNQSNEGKLFLFWNKILELCTRQLRNNNKSLVTSTLVQTTGCLITLGEDKSGLGLFGVIGLGKKSNFSLRFRVVANAMAAFIASMLCRDASLQQSTTSQAASQLNQQTTTRLKNMLADKQYINYKQQIQLACQFIVDDHLSIFDFKYVFWSVVKPLFSDIYYLGVLKCEM